MDAEKIHRWLTQAELDAMLEAARQEGRATSDVEKLRALLAEARCVVDEGLDRSIPSVIQCIDAALAEPVGECARCETLRELADTAAAEQGLAQRRMMEAQKQRDEARAEIERLEALSVKREVMLDKLRWVSQEARVAVMLGYTGPNHETLRKALAQLRVTEDKS